MKNVMDTQNIIMCWRVASKYSAELYTLMVYRPSLENINLPAPF